MPDIQLQALPFNEAIDYFRAKGYKPTFSYKDMEPEAHAYAFTVAKAMRTDILQDIRSAVDDAIANGQTFDSFQKGLKPTLQQKGWWGVQTMVDPKTGEEKEVQLGSPRRLRTIFDTNMRTSYAVGHWEQAQRTKKTLPYFRYSAVMDNRTRPQHKAWNDIVLPIDDPFWDKHYPPNGWNCRCSVQQVGEDDLKDYGLKVTKHNPAAGPDKIYTNDRTGQMIKAPPGVDPSFAYNPGKARMKAITPPPLDRLLEVPYSGPVAKVAMPKPRPVAKDILVSEEMQDEDYVRKFLSQFDAGIGQPKVFNDITGEPIVISDDLFKSGSGKWKVTKFARNQYLLLLAKTLKDPDEIWQVWEKHPRNNDLWSLRRKYISHFKVDGEDAATFALFDTNPEGWTGVTAFKPDDVEYIKRQRKGTLVYRRGETEKK